MITALGMMALVPQFCLAQHTQPSGAITNLVSNPTNDLWDVTLDTKLNHVDTEIPRLHMIFDVDFTQDGGGKLAGAGPTQVSLSYMNKNDVWVTLPPFPATYKVKGTVTSSKGIGKLSYTASIIGTNLMEGKDRKISGSVSDTVKLNAITGQVTGTSTTKGSASGYGATSGKESFTYAVPVELGNGSWTLVMNLVPELKNKMSGAATVTLATGQAYDFAITGTWAPKTWQSKLTLKGFGPSKGSTLSVTMVDNDVTIISGKVSGQTVKVK